MEAMATSSASSSSSSSSLAAVELHAGRRRGGRGSRSCCFPPVCNPSRRSLSLQLTRRRRPEEAPALSRMGSCFCASQHQSPATEVLTEEAADHERRARKSISPEVMDHLITESIGEIVRNIGKAPLLVYISSSYDASTSGRLRLELEAASPERWSHVKKRWDEEESCKPDVVILVEELDHDKSAGAIDAQLSPSMTTSTLPSAAATSKTWGLAVQARGGSCCGGGGAACYILNTTRVRSSAGFCTHFSLVRGCLGESLDVQLKKAWLLQQGRS